MNRRLKTLVSVILGVTLISVVALALIGLHTHKLYVVQTGSMTPTIPSRSLVIVEPGVYHLGQPISFYHGSEVVTHRYVGTNPDGTIITKGDANRTPDINGVPPDKVLGGVIANYNYLGWWLFYLKNPAGIGSVIMIFILIYLVSGLFKDTDVVEDNIIIDLRDESKVTV